VIWHNSHNFSPRETFARVIIEVIVILVTSQDHSDNRVLTIGLA